MQDSFQIADAGVLQFFQMIEGSKSLPLKLKSYSFSGFYFDPFIKYIPFLAYNKSVQCSTLFVGESDETN